MRLFIATILLAGISLASCKSENGKNGESTTLPTSLVTNPVTANGIDTVTAATRPDMVFTDTVHDFGLLHEKETATYDFAFTNPGKSPLVITSANGSCGCTVADFPKEPIPAGKGGVIKVSFNTTGKKGHQDKTVYVNTNTTRGIHMLYIKAEVKESND